MGSFNVACSISNLSIRSGMKTRFYPLVPNSMTTYRPHVSDPHVLHPTSYLIYSNCLFNPFCLPILGEYNDYGTLENIVEDANTRIIEKYFGITIEQFVRCVCNSRDFFDSYSDIFQAYAIDRKIDDYERKLNPELMASLGFGSCGVMTETGEVKSGYTHPDIPDVYVLLEKAEDSKSEKDCGFYLYKDSKLVKAHTDSYDAIRYFLRAIQKESGYYLNARIGDQKRIRLLSNLSGMFVLEDIYQSLLKYNTGNYSKDELKSVADSDLTPEMLKEWGFKKVPEKTQICIDPHHKNLYRKKGCDFEVKFSYRSAVILHKRFREYFCFGLNPSVEEIKKEWERATGTSPKKTFPEPKDIKKTTKKELKKIADKYTELTGNIFGYVKYEEGDVYRYANNARKFQEKWEEFTGERLDISKYEKINKLHNEFDKLVIDAKKFNEKKKTAFREVTVPSVEEQKKNFLDTQAWKKRFASRIGERYVPKKFRPKKPGTKVKVPDFSLEDKDPFGSLSSPNEYLITSHFRDWPYFQELYKKAITRGSLKKPICDHILFSMSMYSCNRIYFPAMNGEQCGNRKEEWHLLKAALKIVEGELNDYYDEWDVDSDSEEDGEFWQEIARKRKTDEC